VSDLIERLRKLKKHDCASCDHTDEQSAHIGGWNAALAAAEPILREAASVIEELKGLREKLAAYQ